jgi:hypothetical protein
VSFAQGWAFVGPGPPVAAVLGPGLPHAHPTQHILAFSMASVPPVVPAAPAVVPGISAVFPPAAPLVFLVPGPVVVPPPVAALPLNELPCHVPTQCPLLSKLNLKLIPCLPAAPTLSSVAPVRPFCLLLPLHLLQGVAPRLLTLRWSLAPRVCPGLLLIRWQR